MRVLILATLLLCVLLGDAQGSSGGLALLNAVNITYTATSGVLKTDGTYLYYGYGPLEKFSIPELKSVQENDHIFSGSTLTMLNDTTAISYYSNNILQIDLETLSPGNKIPLAINSSWILINIFISKNTPTPSTVYATVSPCGWTCNFNTIVSFDINTGKVFNIFTNEKASYNQRGVLWVEQWGKNNNKAGYAAILGDYQDLLYVVDLDSLQLLQTYDVPIQMGIGFVQPVLVSPGFIGWACNSSYFNVFDMEKGEIVSEIAIYNNPVNNFYYTIGLINSDGQGTIYAGYFSEAYPQQATYVSQINFSSSNELSIVDTLRLENVTLTDYYGATGSMSQVINGSLYTIVEYIEDSFEKGQIIEIGAQ